MVTVLHGRDDSSPRENEAKARLLPGTRAFILCASPTTGPGHANRLVHVETFNGQTSRSRLLTKWLCCSSSSNHARLGALPVREVPRQAVLLHMLLKTSRHRQARPSHQPPFGSF